MQASFLGTYRAIVTAISDPLGTRRVRVQCPQISGLAELNWAEPARVYDPIPNIGDIVWIYFNGGETNKPIYAISSNPYFWHTPSLSSGWALGPGGGSAQPLEFRKDTQDNIFITGVIHTTSITPSNPIFTLPPGFTPKIEQRFPAIYNNGGSISALLMSVTIGGAVTVSPFPSASGADVQTSIFFPLGNIA
jgi:hypothetical protein